MTFFSIISSLGLAFLAAFLSSVATSAEASPSATMRFMEHLHSSGPTQAGGEAQLFGELHIQLCLQTDAKAAKTALLSAVAPSFTATRNRDSLIPSVNGRLVWYERTQTAAKPRLPCLLLLGDVH